MQEKNAGVIGKVINTGFLAMSAKDAAGQVGKAVKTQNTRYDDILDTNIVKKNNTLGGANASIIGKSASETIDELYKCAAINNKILKAVGENATKIGKGISKIDAANSGHIAGAISGVKNKQFGKALKEGAKAIPITLPAVAGIIGAGAGTSALLKKSDKKRNPVNDAEYNTVGALLTLGLAANAITSKRMLSPFSAGAKALGARTLKQPLKSAAGASKSVKAVSDVISKSLKQSKKVVSKTEANIAREAQIAERAAARAAKGIKTASDEIDVLYAIEKIAMTPGAKDFAKKVIVDDFFKEGLKAIPYAAAPAGVTYLLQRDLRKGFKKDDKIRKIELSNDEKVASAKPFIKVKSLSEVGAKEIVESAAKGLGRTIFPATVTAVTGRNIMNGFRDINQDMYETKPESMAKNIVIQINPSASKTSIKKQINKGVNEALTNEKKASEQIDDLIAADKELRSKIYSTGDKIARPIHIGNGIKKQFSKHPSEPLLQ